MRLLLYSPAAEDMPLRLTEIATSALPQGKPVCCHGAAELEKRLATPGQRPEVLLLVVPKPSDLAGLSGLVSLFEGTRVILVLPDESQGTVGLALRFRPSFFTSVDSDFEDLGAVLRRIFKLSLS